MNVFVKFNCSLHLNWYVWFLVYTVGRIVHSLNTRPVRRHKTSAKIGHGLLHRGEHVGDVEIRPYLVERGPLEVEVT